MWSQGPKPALLLGILLAVALVHAAAAADPGVADGLFSWHAPGGWDSVSQTWADAAGGGRNAVASPIVPSAADPAVVRQLTAAAGERGASKPVVYVAGSKGMALQFGADPLPLNFTICSVTRVPEVVGDEATLPAGAFGAAVTPNRVLASTASLWVHGHDRGLAGVAGYNQATYKTGGDGLNNFWAWANQGDWLWMCASNAASSCTVYVNGNAFVNGELVCKTTGGTAAGVLAINAQAGSTNPRLAPGVWAIAEVAVWNRWLSDAELRRVLQSLQQRYGFASNAALLDPSPPAPPPAINVVNVVSAAPSSNVASVAGVSILAAMIGLTILLMLSVKHQARRRNARTRRARAAFTYEVFLSYRRSDFAVVDSVADKLNLEGLRVFLDRNGHMAGRPFDRELLRALHTSACCTPVITLHAMRQLASVGPEELDYTLVEYVLALHFSLTGRLKLLYPLMVGVEMQGGEGERPRWDVLWANQDFKSARDALPDVVPTTTLEFADSMLRAELGPSAALHSALRSATIKQIMRARDGDSGFMGLLMHDACSLTGLQEDAELYIRHRFAANVKSLIYDTPAPVAQIRSAGNDAEAEPTGASRRRYEAVLAV